ncbi:MAG: elongation factor Ts [Leptolinea sp.]|jgi:elongation factor Ts|nr:elongation factor Ts [Leptolinea sp.]
MGTTIEQIKQLREATGAGILDCRKALESNNYNLISALADLKEQMAAKASQKNGNATFEGVLEIYSHNNGRVGVMVEVNCETDFTAKSARFRAFAHEIALHIAASAPLWVSDANIPGNVLEKEREKVLTRAREEGKAETLLPRIGEGAITKYMDRTVLLRQMSFRDETISVAQLLAQTAGILAENIIIRRFVRWELAEGMPFAEE